MLIIGVSGGSGSGKTTLVEELIKTTPNHTFSVLPQDAYYKDNSHLSLEDRKLLNFDQPGAIDFMLLISHINQLQKGISISRPIYSFLTCSRERETIPVFSNEILIVEGILIFTNNVLLKKFDIKVYVEATPDEMLKSIIIRDTKERGKEKVGIINRYIDVVMPMYKKFVEPTKKYADVIVQGLNDKSLAVEIIAKTIDVKLKKTNKPCLNT